MNEYNFVDYRDQKAKEFMENDEILTEEKADELALDCWNGLTDNERENFQVKGFEVDEKKIEKIITKMETQRKEIENNKDSKNYYEDGKIKIIRDSLVILQNSKTKTQTLNTENNIIISVPKNCYFIKEFSLLVNLLRSINSFNQGSNKNILDDMIKIEELLKK